MKKQLLKERFQQLAGIKSLSEQENTRPDINSKTLLDLIARDLKFAGFYQNPEMLAFEEAEQIMDHVIEMTGEDYTGQTALLDYINDGEFEKGDKDIYIEPK